MATWTVTTRMSPKARTGAREASSSESRSSEMVLMDNIPTSSDDERELQLDGKMIRSM